MKVVVGGVRGSWPVARRDVMRYGGETTSLLVEGQGGERLLLDLGTGVRRLGERLAAEAARDVLVLLTHYHLDHVVGLPALPMVYREGCAVTFAAPVRAGGAVDDVLPRLLEDPFWPLQMDGMKAAIRFLRLPKDPGAEPLRHGGLEVRWTAVHHHAGCTAFRVDEPATGASMLLATDLEWQRSDADERERLVALARVPAPVGLLFFDAHFTPEEYPQYRDWGHSTWLDAVEVARAAGARRLLLAHHAPFRDDDGLERMERAARAAWDGVSLAVGGETYDPAG